MAAQKFNRPVRAVMNLNQNMNLVGKRHLFQCRYKVGVSFSGKITALELQYYDNGGWTVDASIGTMDMALNTADNTYFFPNYSVTGYACRTNLPTNTSCRAPGCLPSLFFIEHIMDHAADVIAMDPTTLRQANFYTQGQITPYGTPLVCMLISLSSSSSTCTHVTHKLVTSRVCRLGDSYHLEPVAGHLRLPGASQERHAVQQAEPLDQEGHLVGAAQVWHRGGRRVLLGSRQHLPRWHGANLARRLRDRPGHQHQGDPSGSLHLGPADGELCRHHDQHRKVAQQCVHSHPRNRSLTHNTCSLEDGATGGSITSEMCCQAGVFACPRVQCCGLWLTRVRNTQ